MDARKYLIEILDYYRNRLDSELCTMEEIEQITRMLEENMVVYGSISEISKFYGVPEVNVRATINRKLAAKPIRKVLYPFHKFCKIIPDKWRKVK